MFRIGIMKHETRQQSHHNLNIYHQIESFRKSWLKILNQAPWSDLEEIKNALFKENAILIPMYVVHYAANEEKGRLKIRTHTTRNDDTSETKPSMASIERALSLVGLTYETLMSMAVKDDNSQGKFHNELWKGHVHESKGQPPLPDLIKYLLDEKVADLYSEANQARITKGPSNAKAKGWTDWAILLSLRIDRVFSNKDIILTLSITCYDNTAIDEGHWPIPEDEFAKSGKEIIRRFDLHFRKLTEQLYGPEGKEYLPTSSDADRKQLRYEPTTQDAKADEWLELNQAVLSQKGVYWNICRNNINE